MGGEAVRVVTDSLSTCQRLQALQVDISLDSIIGARILGCLGRLVQRNVELELIWCPSQMHC